MPFYAGKGGSFSIGATAYPMDTWSISVDTDEVEVTNFQSSGQKSLIAGSKNQNPETLQNARGEKQSHFLALFVPCVGLQAPGCSAVKSQFSRLV